jgi:hypothetical protein
MTVEPCVQVGEHSFAISSEFVINFMPQSFIEFEGLVLCGDAVEKRLWAPPRK